MPTGPSSQPQNIRDKNTTSVEPEPAPHHARLKNISEDQVNHQITGQQNQCIIQATENQHLQNRRDGRQHGTDVGNIVKRKGEQSPDERKPHIQRNQHAPDNTPGDETDRRFQHQIAETLSRAR